MLALMATAVWLNLGAMFLTALFSYLLLRVLMIGRRKWLAVTLFTLVIAAIGALLFWFGNQALITLPRVAETAIPSIVAWAQQYGRELPFTDWDSLKTSAMTAVVNRMQYLNNVAGVATDVTRLVVQVIIGTVIAVSVFLNAAINLDRDEPDSLYGLCTQELAVRFRTFFGSFSIVMGAQIIISAINTALTGIFITAVNIPHHLVLMGVTFLCGLLPVVGNLISNTVTVAVAFTVSPKLALWALIFLVVIHKLEYFLNSKIIGDRIRNPIWLTLIALVVGEALMGIPGMILAPVVLHYIKVEASRVKLPSAAEDVEA
jgi:predicted PurR-regulated permease PerM